MCNIYVIGEEENILYNDEKIKSLQSLRFIGFIFIFFWHTQRLHNIKFAYGTLAVSFFILLSGFLNGYKYFYKINDISIKSILNFTRKRVNKFYNLHIITLLLMIPFTSFFYITEIKQFVKFFIELIINMFLMQSYVNNSNIYFGFNGVSWYLSLTVFLTIVTIPLMYIIKKIKEKTNCSKILVVIAIIILILDILYALIIEAQGLNKQFWLYVFPLARIPEYFIGIVVGIYFRENKKTKSKYTILELITLSLVISTILGCVLKIIPEYLSKGVIWIIPNILIIYVFAFEQGFVSKMLKYKILVKLGDLTMEAFLIHQVIIKYVYLIIGYNNINKYSVLIFILIVTIIISYVIYESNRKYLSKSNCSI